MRQSELDQLLGSRKNRVGLQSECCIAGSVFVAGGPGCNMDYPESRWLYICNADSASSFVHHGTTRCNVCSGEIQHTTCPIVSGPRCASIRKVLAPSSQTALKLRRSEEHTSE